MYRPMRAFLVMGGTLTAAGFLLGVRFLWYYVQGEGSGKVQSLLLAVILTVIGAQTILTGLLSDLIGINRKLMEETLLRVKRLELSAVRERDGDLTGRR
jgi:hypothetical protein